jgi:hypothetical protein
MKWMSRGANKKKEEVNEVEVKGSEQEEDEEVAIERSVTQFIYPHT